MNQMLLNESFSAVVDPKSLLAPVYFSRLNMKLRRQGHVNLLSLCEFRSCLTELLNRIFQEFECTLVVFQFNVVFVLQGFERVLQCL